MTNGKISYYKINKEKTYDKANLNTIKSLDEQLRLTSEHSNKLSNADYVNTFNTYVKNMSDVLSHYSKYEDAFIQTIRDESIDSELTTIQAELNSAINDYNRDTHNKHIPSHYTEINTKVIQSNEKFKYAIEQINKGYDDYNKEAIHQGQNALAEGIALLKTIEINKN